MPDHLCRSVVVPPLLRTPSTLLLQHLFLLFLDFRIDLGTFGRLVAVVFSLVET